MAKTGTGRIYQRGGVWWIDYGHNGKRYRESSGSTRKSDATDLLKRRMGEAGKGKLVGPSEKRVTFDDLAAIVETDYKVQGNRSLDRLRIALGHLGRFFGEDKALTITPDRVKAYIANRQEEGASASSIQKELAALKRAFKLAVLEGVLSARPELPSIRVRNTRKGFFNPKELERLIAELPEPLRAPVRFAALTGWRKAEVLSLEWSSVDFEAGVVRLAPGTTKNEEGREFPFFCPAPPPGAARGAAGADARPGAGDGRVDPLGVPPGREADQGHVRRLERRVRTGGP
ncbi:MAG: site-specific integrase [Gemmatimonadota bacterium]